MNEHYQPIHDDILRAKVRTSGIMERTYEVKDAFISIYDVGGQRNERKKWIHCFAGVTGVIYVAALNHYKQVLFEDEGRNAMHESVDLFASLCSSKWFRTIPMILFLNKDDLFREALRDGISLSCCFSAEANWDGDSWRGSDYIPVTSKSGDEVEANYNDTEAQIFDACYKQALEFIKDQYIKCGARYQLSRDDGDEDQILSSPRLRRKIFAHVTNATDRNNIEKVFWDCQNIAVRGNLLSGGYI